jgi:hypothetical protein
MYVEFWWGSQKERDHQEDIDIGERIILKCILERVGERRWDGMGCIHLAQDRN